MKETGRGFGRFRTGGVVALALLGVTTAHGSAQQETERRPVPAAVTSPTEFRRAVDRGWRSEDGSPGPGYWQEWSGYDIDVRLDPETGVLTGSEQILFAHQAPATFTSIWLHLYQNIHKAESPRNESQEITGGVTLRRVAVDGEDLGESPSGAAGYRVRGTLMEVTPTVRVEQGDTVQLDIEWEVTLPQNGVGRMGYSNRELYLVAYWFPKVAVFDNLYGWSPQPYLGVAEFYDDFSDYAVEISVPQDWTVMATGTLENPEEVFSVVTQDRLEAASVADTLVTIAGRAERDAGVVTADSDDGWLTYRFTATDVRDFAWTTSNVQRWNATSALVPDRDGDGEDDRVLIHSFWREDRAPLWSQQWEYAKQSIEQHSRYTGLSYPWPHMTSVEGADIIGGGMEFPMLTLIGPYEGRDPQALFNVTAHELGHMWVPMIVGTDENRHAWMDEGATTFLEDQARMAIWPGVDHHRVEARTYLQAAAAGVEQSMMRHGDYYEPGPGYTVASYSKPATLMVALREIMGEQLWEEAYRAFLSEWAFKHPTPWDFFNTFERFAEKDLDWFWTSFYYETWSVDHAVRGVTTQTGGGATVTIEDRGQAPYPTVVRIRTSAGNELRREIGVEYWLDGNSTYDIEVPASEGTVTRVEVDPSGYAPDVDRDNNFWPRG